MVWARFDDNWSEREDVLALSPEQRWHLIGMIIYCCRFKRWDGQLRTADARRASDANDPDAALAALTAAGLITRTPAGYEIVGIGHHIPPKSVRDDSDRKRRERAHRKGEHELCSPSNCDVLAVVFSRSSEPVPEPVPVPVPVPVPEGPGVSPQDGPQDREEFDKRGNEVPAHLRGMGAHFDATTRRWANKQRWLT